MSTPFWQLQYGSGPLVAAAIHDGGEVRAELQPWMQISADDRRREEDPFTSGWTSVAPTRIVGLHSRFEFDLNRPRDKAVYLRPEDCWGLKVWHRQPTPDLVEHSLTAYDSFYAHVKQVLDSLVLQHGRIVVFDLHSYNHRRRGPEAAPADAETHPEINIGTGTMRRDYWSPIVERVMHDLGEFDYLGRGLDVRENVKFQGGYFPRWIHENYHDSVCAIAIEFKKFFMDEWTGEPDYEHITAISQALRFAAAGVVEELQTFDKVATRR